jgi:hypothetical protein
MRRLRRTLAVLIASCALTALAQVPATAVTDVEVTVTPDRPGATYLYGQSITLTATTTPVTDLDHWHWFIKEPGDQEFEVSQFGETAELRLPHSMTWDGAQVYAELYGDDHQVVGRSDPLTLNVDRLPATTTLLTSTDKESYRVGDRAQLSSTQSPATADDHYHWYLRPRGEEYFIWIDGTSEADAALDLTAAHDGAEVIARLFSHDHVILAESAPIRLEVRKVESALTVRVGNAPLDTRERPRLKVRIAATAAPTGTVTVKVDGRVRATGVAHRRSTLVIAPLDRGRHRLRVVYSGDDVLDRAVVTRPLRVHRAG